MPKLHTSTHNVPALEQRLKDLLEEPPERVAFSPAKLTATQELVRRFAASGPLPRRIVNALKAWRLTGYSPRWLAVRLPVVRTVGRKAKGFLLFRRRVNAHLNQLDHHLIHQSEHINRLIGEVSHNLTQRVAESSRNLSTDFEARLAAERENSKVQAAAQDERMAGMERTLKQLQQALAISENRLTLLETSGRSGTPAADGEQDFGDYYLALENLYRGESSAIEARFEPYLGFISEAGVGGEQDPVIDLGCGRGEWLRILQRQGLHSIGIDSDAGMLQLAREGGSNVIQGDMLPFLESAAPESVGAVTAFQVVEHLPLEVLMRMFAGAKKVLRPGGVIILETPNPENLQVAGYSFWLDPTHIKPLPPPLLDYFARYFGFIDVRIVRTHPWPAEQQFPEDTPAARHLNKLLFCEQDYALVARKPL
ncbi:class I SAM-dependent methyltransferase [Noviherbaspirillum aerium]|uniref:class I SAM-dependent methyltransferase n=1 Tax=Noviherbaspirillum aerium TaxID=2588497 RepID=UPI00124BF7B7|nr:class I SAM-dependent methyltransferase [Noviherbaspirillum aerium]